MWKNLFIYFPIHMIKYYQFFNSWCNLRSTKTTQYNNSTWKSFTLCILILKTRIKKWREINQFYYSAHQPANTVFTDHDGKDIIINKELKKKRSALLIMNEIWGETEIIVLKWDETQYWMGIANIDRNVAHILALNCNTSSMVSTHLLT